ncbi:hypothetical protein ACROYT_G002606 [Oculina patagonica]
MPKRRRPKSTKTDFSDGPEVVTPNKRRRRRIEVENTPSSSVDESVGRQEFVCTLQELRVHAEGAALWARTSAQLRGVSIQGDTLLRLIVNGPPSWGDFDVFVA